VMLRNVIHWYMQSEECCGCIWEGCETDEGVKKNFGTREILTKELHLNKCYSLLNLGVISNIRFTT